MMILWKKCHLNSSDESQYVYLSYKMLVQVARSHKHTRETEQPNTQANQKKKLHTLRIAFPTNLYEMKSTILLGFRIFV